MNSEAKQVSLWERIKKQKLLLLMTVPGLVLTFIFKYIPMYGVLIAFKDYNPLKGVIGLVFLSLQNSYPLPTLVSC